MKVLRWCHLYVVVGFFVCFRSKCRRQKNQVINCLRCYIWIWKTVNRVKLTGGGSVVVFMSLLYGTAGQFNQVQIPDLCHPLNKRKTAC